MPLASLGDLRAGVRAGGPMVSQVSPLRVCAGKDTTRKTQCMDVNKEPFQWFCLQSTDPNLFSVCD